MGLPFCWLQWAARWLQLRLARIPALQGVCRAHKGNAGDNLSAPVASSPRPVAAVSRLLHRVSGRHSGQAAQQAVARLHRPLASPSAGQSAPCKQSDASSPAVSQAAAPSPLTFSDAGELLHGSAWASAVLVLMTAQALMAAET